MNFALRMVTYRPEQRKDRDYKCYERRWIGFRIERMTPKEYVALEQWVKARWRQNRGYYTYFSRYRPFQQAAVIWFRSYADYDACFDVLYEMSKKRTVEFPILQMPNMNDLHERGSPYAFGVFPKHEWNHEELWVSMEDCPEATLIKMLVS